MVNDPIIIVAAVRTPIGSFQGALSHLTAAELGGLVLKAAVERSGISYEQIDEVIMGCVLPAGVGQAPARQAAINAELPLFVNCTTINKACGSGMKAVMLAHDLISTGTNKVMIAGGMESMSNAPHLLLKARKGYRLGHGDRLLDHMFYDGLEDSYYPESRGQLMGTFAETCARDYGFTREQQDHYAIESTQRARTAIAMDHFAWEIMPITLITHSGSMILEDDELPSSINIERVATLPPAFEQGGTVTAANSSSISDGAAALVITHQSIASKLGVRPLATIVSHVTHAQAPHLFTSAPIGAIQKLLKKIGWEVKDVDLWEINEAFAVVTMAAMQTLKIPHAQVNIHGGACALGHPVGASGARIVTTLIGALQATGGTRGVAAICIGGGEATAIALELQPI